MICFGDDQLFHPWRKILGDRSSRTNTPLIHEAMRTRTRVCGRAIKRLQPRMIDRKSTRLNSSHRCISYAVFCLKKKREQKEPREIKILADKPDLFTNFMQ